MYGKHLFSDMALAPLDLASRLNIDRISQTPRRAVLSSSAYGYLWAVSLVRAPSADRSTCQSVDCRAEEGRERTCSQIGHPCWVDEFYVLGRLTASRIGCDSVL